MAALPLLLTLAVAAAAAAILVLAGGWMHVLLTYLGRAPAALAEERRLLASPLPPDAELPHLSIQIPVFNEGALAARAVAGAVALDWPRDKLHVQVLDDSTNRTTGLARAAVDEARARGFNVAHLRRGSRKDFKAGNLNAGLRAADHQFVAIFDADEMAPADFPRLAMRPLLQDRRISFVQARREFHNEDENWLTRTQALIQDAHFHVEQPARAWGGQSMGFDGSCGIWRRAAIDEAGGWSGDTLTEDIDLAYRAYLKGWRPFFLTEVAVRSELPATLPDWQRQQRRWSTGHAQTSLRILPRVWRSDLPFRRKVESTLHLGSAALGPLIAAEVACVLVAAVAGVALPWWVVGLVAAGPLVGVAVGLGMSLAACRARRKPLDARFWGALSMLLVLVPYMNVRHAAAAWIAVRFRPAAFETTPKKGQ